MLPFEYIENIHLVYFIFFTVRMVSMASYFNGHECEQIINRQMTSSNIEARFGELWSSCDV